MSEVRELPVVFGCAGERLLGVASLPERPAARGVLIVVGGPQYRTGSHRQFTLLARHLARQGIAALRFDCRGMGDSSGAARGFEAIDEDIACAIDAFQAAAPEMKEIVLWGLCDAACAALFYAHRDARVGGLVLVNPWVRTEAGAAQAKLRHYYVRRLLQPAFWGKLARGEFKLRESARDFGRAVGGLALGERGGQGSLPDRMLEGLRGFGGRVLVVLSGDDLTAQEFRRVTEAAADWRRELESARVTRRELPGANHTFARREWREELARWTAEWVSAPR